MEESLFARYEQPEKFFETTVYPTKTITMKLPHWCFPDDKNFCDSEKREIIQQTSYTPA